MTEHRFELIGGHPALDFLNTVHDWTAADPRDYLAGFPEALRFAIAAGVMTRAETQRIAPEPAGSELRKLRDVRAGLERIFRAVVEERAPAQEDLDALARDAAEAARGIRFRTWRGRVVRAIDVDLAGAAALRWRIVDSSLALLTSAAMERVSACPSCGWFFLDTSKNRSRRWCSMATCGSSEKARRYYWRTRQRSTARSDERASPGRHARSQPLRGRS